MLLSQNKSSQLASYSLFSQLVMVSYKVLWGGCQVPHIASMFQCMFYYMYIGVLTEVILVAEDSSQQGNFVESLKPLA